jgi:hypothetical protein
VFVNGGETYLDDLVSKDVVGCVVMMSGVVASRRFFSARITVFADLMEPISAKHESGAEPSFTGIHHAEIFCKMQFVRIGLAGSLSEVSSKIEKSV